MAGKQQIIEIENLTRNTIDLGSFLHDGHLHRVYLGSRDDIGVGVEHPDATKGECHSPIKRYPRGVVEQAIKLKAVKGMIELRDLRIAGAV